MYSWVRLSHLAQWAGGKLQSNTSDPVILSVSTDTRTLQRGDLFAALIGENFDGHDYIQKAVELGAAAILSEKEISVSVPVIRVSNTLQALAGIGRELRKKFMGPVVAVTGSAGKSSTKDMLTTLLGERTLKSPKSFNNLLGISKTLSLVEDSTERLVLEVGMNNFGEIKEICENFDPEVGVITNIGDAHLGKLGGREGVYKAKKELFDYLKSRKGGPRGVVVNLDDDWVVKAAQENFSSTTRQLTYSTRKELKPDLWISKRELDSKTGRLLVEIQSGSTVFSVTLSHFGKHHAYNLAASIGVAKVLGLSDSVIQSRLVLLQPSDHRGEWVELDKGITLIDESYNSNPGALQSSLESVMTLDSKRRKVLVIGEMRELEQFSSELHHSCGRFLRDLIAKNTGPLTVVGVTGHAKELVQELQSLSSVDVQFVPDVAAAISLVPTLLRPQDLLFIKGSRGVQLDRLVKEVVGILRK